MSIFTPCVEGCELICASLYNGTRGATWLGVSHSLLLFLQRVACVSEQEVLRNHEAKRHGSFFLGCQCFACAFRQSYQLPFWRQQFPIVLSSGGSQRRKSCCPNVSSRPTACSARPPPTVKIDPVKVTGTKTIADGARQRLRNSRRDANCPLGVKVNNCWW